MVDKRGAAKVADFGLSNKNHLGGTGTPYWMAPELLRKETGNTVATDVYSFGSEFIYFPKKCLQIFFVFSLIYSLTPIKITVILYEIFARKDPYEGEIASEVLQAVADKNTRKRPVLPSYVPDQIKHIMIDCLQDEATQRPTFQELGMRFDRLDFYDFEKTVLFPPQHEASVFDVFPGHIAKAIHEGRQTHPEQREMVSV